MELSKRRNIWFVIIIGFIIFAVFASQIGIQRLLDLINEVNKPLLLLVVIFNLLNLLAFTITWQLLTSANISLYKLFKFYMAGTFINNITPTFGTGGEPIKAMLLGAQTGKSKAECFASVISQRMVNMVPFLTVGIIGLVLMFGRPGITLNLWEITGLVFSIVAGFGIYFLLIYFYMYKDKLSSFVHSSIRFFAPFIGLMKKGFDHIAYSEAVEESINSFHGGLKEIHHNKKDLLKKAILFSYIGWMFDILAIYTIFLAIPGSHIHVSVLIITYTISMISGWLPLFLPGGLGIVDGTMAGLFIFGGVPVEIAILATMLYRLSSYWFNTILGAICLGIALKKK
ncbi:MAG: flippase-like domain-containing protein [Candidatus Methanoperedens sp.]|nr:flippase-like domain-containing protein [Candidatus Methanoperedens sp.]